jgi:Fur family transcriptional regulator, ferric uptake regulator
VRHTHLSDRAPTYHSVTGHEHFHLKCRGCGAVVSVDVEVAGPLSDELARRFGFRADLGHLTLFGQCETCHEKA